LVLPVATLLQWWKIWFFGVKYSHVPETQCTITPSLQDVEFLDHKTPDFMFPCCSVLTR